MRKPPTVRALAIRALCRWEKGHVYADSLIQQAAKKHALSKEDRNLLNAMLVDTIRHLRKIDFWISQLRDGKLDEKTRNTLRIGLCQLHILEIPAHAAVNETVNTCNKSTKGLVNALLRKSLREASDLEAATAKQPIAVTHSHPNWLCQRWMEEFGETQTSDLLQWNQLPSQTIFRLNSLKNNVHHLLSEVDNISTIPDHPDFFISQGLPPQAWLDDGLIYIQDPATSHSIDLLAPIPGETILDACAAPGGKSTQIAAFMQNAGKLICTDSNAKRLPRLEQNLQRLGVTNASCQEHDWTAAPPEHFLQKFDGILLDVPCSNTGVFRRRIDARWRLKADDIRKLQNIQLSILTNAATCVRSEGRIVYSTCSIDRSENIDLIQHFLSDHPDFKLIKHHQALPQIDQTDGAFAALLKKV